MPSSPHMSRRQFVAIVTAATGTVMGALIGIPAIGYLISPALQKVSADVWIPAGPVANYTEGVPSLFSFNRTIVNGWEKTVNSYGAYIVKQADGSCLALSNKCTHLSCRVNWKAEESAYICPCHDAYFGIDGEIIKGPQPRPLDEYQTKIENDILYLHFVGS
jgi:menaquinol-cytochrome c reductase iron-sulfur subunit